MSPTYFDQSVAAAVQAAVDAALAAKGFVGGGSGPAAADLRYEPISSLDLPFSTGNVGISFVPASVAQTDTGGGTAVTIGNVANELVGLPLSVSKGLSFSTLGINVTTAVASSTARVGIYQCDSNGRPTTTIWDSGSIDTGTTGVKSFGSLALSVPRGDYWVFGIVSSVSVQFTGYSSGNRFATNGNTPFSGSGCKTLKPGGISTTPASALPDLSSVTAWSTTDFNGRGLPIIMGVK